MSHPAPRPATLAELKASGWRSRGVKQEVRENLVAALERGEPLFPGILGYDDTVIPAITHAVLAGHDMLFLGEKGQGKTRLMRAIARFLDPEVPFLDLPGCPVHEDPLRPITAMGKRHLAATPEDAVRIGWWRREDRVAERLAPGTRFADLIGEIDPAKMASGTSLSAEEVLHFGLVPRMHRGIFALNELPDLDESVQVGLFNVLEERDVQIRGHPIRFDLDVMLLFSANPGTYNRSGKVIPQLKDRIGSTISTHYPRERALGIAITRQEAGLDLGGAHPVVVPPFMDEIVEQLAVEARGSRLVDQSSGVSARFSLANWRTMIASARARGIRLGERPSVPRISDLAHLGSSATGKLELDALGNHAMDEKQLLEALLAAAIRVVFTEYVDEHGLDAIAGDFAKGLRLEVGDMLPSSHYEARLKDLPAAWSKAFEVNAAGDPAVRASCVEFVLAGLWATDRISRSERHGRIRYES